MTRHYAATTATAGTGSMRELAIAVACEHQLRSSTAGGGETDFWQKVSRRDRNRLRAAGFTAAGGLAADRFATVCQASGLLPADLVNGNADQVCAWWIDLALRSLEEGSGRDRWTERMPSEDECDPLPTLPAWCEQWIAGLVCPQKAAYARAYAESVWLGYEAPVAPARDWVRKVERKIANRLAAEVVRIEGNK